MSRDLYELPDRYILDSGEVAEKHVRAVERILSGKRLDGHLYAYSDDLIRFVNSTGQTPRIWSYGEPESPTSDTFEWNIPVEALQLDPTTHLANLLKQYTKDMDEARADLYIDRCSREWALVEEFQMEDFIRTMIHIVKTFREKGVVWGVGRGSSVESLILFLIGVHRIDPIEHDIDLEYFFRTK